jgi:mannose-6-phosphate isomerase-like protein (cupin superfamily)
MPPTPFVVHESQVPLEAWDDPARGSVTWRTLLSADRTPSDALTMGVAEVREAGGAGPALHRHAHAEAYFVLSGRGVLHIDGEEYPLAPGAAAFIPGGALHGAHGVGEAPLRLLYVFAADSFDQIRYEFPAAE